MSSQPSPLNDAPFLAAVDLCLDLASRPEVEEKWDQPSALERLSVGALACHLTRQVARAAELLGKESTSTPITAQEHYARAEWVTAESLDDPANDRSADEADAALGFVACITRGMAAHRAVLAQLAGDQTPAAIVEIPWQGWSLTRADFLLTRMVEIVVHADDLAVSVGVETPEFAPEVFGPVHELLVAASLARHGQAATLRALTRAERAESITAF